MDQKIKNDVETGLKNSVNTYKVLDILDANKPKVLNILSKEVKMITDQETHVLDSDLKTKKHDLDKTKVEEQLKIEKKKFDLEELKAKHQRENDEKKATLEQVKVDHQKDNDSEKLKVERSKLNLDRKKVANQIEIDNKKIDLEYLKIELETRRLELDQLKLERENDIRLKETEKSKWDRITHISLKVLEIGAPLAVNAALVLLNLKLIYADDGRVPSEMKDLMKNIYRK